MKKAYLIVAVATVAAIALIPLCHESEADVPDQVLFDSGNGTISWVTAASGATLMDVVRNTAVANGIQFSESGGIITALGKTQTTIGAAASGGSFSSSGTTGKTITSSWHIFRWTGSSWTDSNPGEAYTSGTVALGHYPAGITPVTNPVNKSVWTMVRGDASQSANQSTYSQPSGEASVAWTDTRGGTSGVNASVLGADGRIFVKFGTSVGMGATKVPAALRCYDSNGNMLWNFEFPGILYYETATPLIAGDYIYVASGYGYILKLPWRTGPGTNNCDVTTFGGMAYSSADIEARQHAIPYETGASLTGSTYSTGIGSMIFDSGAIYCTSSNGMAYCFDTNLNLIWSRQLGGSVYYTSPAISGGYLFTGALNGHLYAIDSSSGAMVGDETVYQFKTSDGKTYGSVMAPICVRDGAVTSVMFSVSDGRGMNSVVGGIGIYEFNGSSLSKKHLSTSGLGMVSTYIVAYKNGTFTGACFASSDGLFRISTGGIAERISDKIGEVHSGPVVVNKNRIYLSGYTAGTYNYITDIDGKLLCKFPMPADVRNYSMSPMIPMGGVVVVGNDAGIYCIKGAFVETEPAPEKDSGISLTVIVLIAILTAFVAAAIIVYYIKRKTGTCPLKRFAPKEGESRVARNRRRLFLTIAAGAVVAIIMFFFCLSMGSTESFSIPETLSLLMSAIGKGGQNLTQAEILVYYSRLPRTLVAFAVGIGLSVAGAIYQAIIRNPLVDPYIMGVSSGAGTAAIVVIAFNFTFFGLFPAHSVYLTAIVAMIGGVIAFIATMFLAERSGGSSTNYVLSGVVIGLAFSAVQTLMLSMAGHKVSGALSWLFGSFASVSWGQVWAVFIPALAISLASLLWVKELNLVLLGEDQAKQMGLNVRKFNRGMLILASVLTSVCVAFVGIIGFVGLVIPHLCRMILGGDHRLVLPASMVLGCSLMMGADLFSRMIMPGIELPVGAITTMIGVPVFAYLLMRKGRMYDG